MRVACVQQRAQGIEDYKEIYENLKGLILEAVNHGTELIVLPECAYPAYFLGINEEICKEAVKASELFLEQIVSLAQKNRVYIAVGIAINENGKLCNAAYLFDDNGNLVHKTGKSNMWHFDSKWFTPSTEYTAFDTKFGKMGMLVCADGRIPEIARILSKKGAKVIIDLVNLAASAAEPKNLMNQQYEFILPVRAMENQTWFLVADKAGMEANTVSYLGRSMIIAPDGKIVKEASTERQEIIYYDIDMEEKKAELEERRPELYGDLIKDVKKLDVLQVMRQELGQAADAEVYLSTAAFQAMSREEYICKARYYIKACELMGSKILCLPQLRSDEDIESMIKELKSFLKSNMILIVSGKRSGYKGAIILDKTNIYGTYYKTHGKESKRDEQLKVVETPFGRLAIIFDQEAYVQELPRVYMLKGCDILIWSDCEARTMNTQVMQTRGAENKIFVVRTSNAREDTSSVVNPDGRLVTSTFYGEEQAASGMVFLPLARSKSIVPGTDVVLGRIGDSYHALVD